MLVLVSISTKMAFSCCSFLFLLNVGLFIMYDHFYFIPLKKELMMISSLIYLWTMFHFPKFFKKCLALYYVLAEFFMLA